MHTLSIIQQTKHARFILSSFIQLQEYKVESSLLSLGVIQVILLFKSTSKQASKQTTQIPGKPTLISPS